MLCTIHPEETIKSINIDPDYEGNRLACLECLVEQSDKHKSSFIRINKVLQDPHMILNSEHLKCNISLNTKYLQEQNFQNVLLYLIQQIIIIRNKIISALDDLAQKINQFLQIYHLIRPNYIQECNQSIEMILFRIGWLQLKERLQQINKPDEQIQINNHITQMIVSYKNLELSDEYNQLNSTLVKSLEYQKHLFNQQIQEINLEIPEFIQQLTEYSRNIFTLPNLSKFESSVKSLKDIAQKKQLQLAQQQKDQDEKLQREIMLSEKYHKDLEHYEYKLSHLLLPQSLSNLSYSLYDIIIGKKQQPPREISVRYFNKFKYFSYALQALEEDLSYIVVIEMPTYIVGCYYPDLNLQISDQIFFSHGSVQQLSSIKDSIQSERSIKFSHDNQNTLRIIFSSQQLELTHESLMCWLNENTEANNYRQIVRMSIIEIQ